VTDAQYHELLERLRAQRGRYLKAVQLAKAQAVERAITIVIEIGGSK